MDKHVKTRLKWIELYLETRDAGHVCRRCGISRPTLRKWYERYLQKGLNGLIEYSRRPHSSPPSKNNLTPC
jgi:transposase-like protein